MNITEQRDWVIDARTTRHESYLLSQRIRKRIEACFGCGKDARPMRKMKLVGKEQVNCVTTLTVGLYTLLRLAKLLAEPERNRRRITIHAEWHARCVHRAIDVGRYEDDVTIHTPDGVRLHQLEAIQSRHTDVELLLLGELTTKALAL
jgi:hypothetical protein